MSTTNFRLNHVHHILNPSIDNGKWLETKILKERNAAISTDIKNSGWKPFPSQDIPSLFNYGHVYHYALESLLSLLSDQVCDHEEKEETGI